MSGHREKMLVSLAKKQNNPGDFNQDLHKPELANTVYALDQEGILENLTPFDINSLPIIFEEDIDACCTDTCSTSIPSGAINLVLENGNEDTDLKNPDDISNYSISAGNKIELENLIDPDRRHIDDEGITSQTVQIDQDEIPKNENPLEPDYGNMLEGRKRSIKHQEDKWGKNKTKRQRMEGQPYMGYSRNKDGKVSYNIPREARKLGPPCKSKECIRVKNKYCSKITEEERLKIFNSFWKDMNWDQRKIFVINHVTKSNAKRTYTKTEDSRRKNTLQHFLTVGNEKLQVCKKMFLQTLCLGEFSVQDWVKKGDLSMTTSTEFNKQTKKPSFRADKDADKEYLKEFFDKLPKLPSHYARSSSTKLYLETTVESLTHLFKLYRETCNNDNRSVLSRTVFNSMFHSNNLALHPIKKDKCDLCTKHEVGQLSDEEWSVHRRKKDRARDEKNKDKEEAKTNTTGRVLTVDLQAVKVCPFVQASAIFLKLKLCCHNFTVYDTVSHQATCFWFTETDADMTASTFVSCLLKYLEIKCQNESGPIIIYSDGCTYQNRNSMMANALLNYAVVNNVEIVQKFLEVGHTQMECDSVHSCIERKIKGKDIHLPSDYLRISKEARSKPAPYDVVCMQYTDFKDFTPKRFHRYYSIRPGRVVNDPVVTDIRALRYLPNEKNFYKLDFDADWKELPQRPKKVLDVVEWPAMYNEKRKIKKQKWQHLQALKSVIPSDCHAFYDNLAYYSEV